MVFKYIIGGIMKKIGKVLLAFLLVIGVGFTGFTLGKNSSKDNTL